VLSATECGDQASDTEYTGFPLVVKMSLGLRGSDTIIGRLSGR
jgi:carbamoylphosphate synthase large subunit